ncbi:GNAT family N-acetyltransferase [Rahnella sikkimica]|uniref:GNAT family N-acetyltransferase n=1 Tax=Rahnella sikkimica TaxID=1805933 RepID=A0A2L1UXZ4_9GAMM|nr:GNAT family N-acetyltransferase [Rahnella sikkimica]AVF37822.1 GNAT family N-acetyltransferase [Rahnella sikkimica]
MDDATQPDYLILPINQFHKSKSFKSGSAEYLPLKTFLQKEAVKFRQGFIAQTYVVVDDDERKDKNLVISDYEYTVLGYITLTCSEVAIEGYKLEGCESAEKYASLPAVKIARFAVDCRERGKKIGKLLFEHALFVAKEEIMPRVGCRFLVTDAKQGAIDFYHSREMQLLETDANRQKKHPVMFIDLCDFPL